MAEQPDKELLGLTLEGLTAYVEELGQPRYRARQLFEAIYRQRLADVGQITTLPQAFRRELQQAGARIGLPRLAQKFTSLDGTIRYLLAFADGQTVETVWMPEGDGGEEGDEIPAGVVPLPATSFVSAASLHTPSRGVGETSSGSSLHTAKRHTLVHDSSAKVDRKNWSRATICISSQVGCAVDCQFCMTALLGIQRNLTAGEIVGQVLVVLRDRGVDLDRDRINLVFMGQGEPFLNYEQWITAVRLLVEGVSIPAPNMTVSTAGIVPRIADLGREPVRPKLAISLNASNDEVRGRIMPINRKWNIGKLLDAARSFPLRARERLTFEYVLLDGINDEPQHARELVALVRGLRAKINLIALNPGPEIPFSTPSDRNVQTFQQVLVDAGIPAFVRRPRGRDIYAACGQLKKMAG